MSILDNLDQRTPEERKQILTVLELAAAKKRRNQWFLGDARPEQIPPDDWWYPDHPQRSIYYRGGRGSGKTRSAGEVFAELIRRNPYLPDEPNEWGVVAPTFSDARDTCIEGPSGLIAALGGRAAGGKLVRTGPLISNWNRSMGQLYLKDGTVIYADGADDGALRIQGKNLRGVWADELGLWRKWRLAWDESIKYAVRIAPAKRVMSGTPKRNMPAIELVRRLLHDPRVINRRLRTEDNAANLDPMTLEELLEARGTALGAQELEGDVLEEAEGAMWTRDPVKAEAEQLGLIISEVGALSEDMTSLVFPDRVVKIRRTYVALDPSEGGEESDEQGTVAASLGHDGRYYVLYARGDRTSPMAWLKAAQGMYERLGAQAVLLEKDGALGFKMTLEANFPDLKYEFVSSQGKNKTIRAEPIAALYARRLVTHVLLPDGSSLTGLEAQMTSWTGDVGQPSPGQLDALVYALRELRGNASPARSSPVAGMRLPQMGYRR